MSDADDDQVEAVEGLEANYLGAITKIVCTYVKHNPTSVDKLGDVITTVTAAIVGGAGGANAATEEEAPAEDDDQQREPAVPIRKSITPDHLICLECGEHRRTLKLHLERRHSLSFAAYRERWELPDHYPKTAPLYAQKRSEECKARGFGRKREEPDA